jgi:choline dehydrogenase-like flavoprotein
MLDVGHMPPAHAGITGNFYAAKREPEQHLEALVGNQFESLHNVAGGQLMPKLKAPLRRFVIRDSHVLGAIRSNDFDGLTSFARGGLANAWGGQLYRFDARDLADFPIGPEDLAPFYDELTAHIGVSGCDDDLSRFYGPATGLLPPVRLTPLGADLLCRYRARCGFFHRHGVFMGLPRLGLLTADHGGRPAHGYDNTDFFNPVVPSLYTPRATLDALLAAPDGPTYVSGRMVLGFREAADHVDVTTRNLADGSIETFAARALLLGAGTLGSARLALLAQNDHTTRLPLLENLLSYIPFVAPRFFGTPQIESSFYAQANLCMIPDDGALITGTFYAISGLLHSEFLFDLPLSARANVLALKYILPTMLVLHLWYPAVARPGNALRLGEDGAFVIDYGDRISGEVERKLVRLLRRIGYWSLGRLARFPRPGQSFHYAGTLPMRAAPGPYETGRDGRLYGTRRVYVVDGATFPSLPAKNLSFTIMANAMRVARRVAAELSGQ